MTGRQKRKTVVNRRHGLQQCSWIQTSQCRTPSAFRSVTLCHVVLLIIPHCTYHGSRHVFLAMNRGELHKRARTPRQAANSNRQLRHAHRSHKNTQGAPLHMLCHVLALGPLHKYSPWAPRPCRKRLGYLGPGPVPLGQQAIEAW